MNKVLGFLKVGFSLGARTSRPRLSAKRENVLFGGLYHDEMVALSQRCGRDVRAPRFAVDC